MRTFYSDDDDNHNFFFPLQSFNETIAHFNWFDVILRVRCTLSFSFEQSNFLSLNYVTIKITSIDWNSIVIYILWAPLGSIKLLPVTCLRKSVHSITKKKTIWPIKTNENKNWIANKIKLSIPNDSHIEHKSDFIVK